MKVTREDVIEVFKQHPDESLTTLDIAKHLGKEEYRVRACVSWLVGGGVLVEDGVVQRRDKENRPYQANQYRWTGKEQIERVPQDPNERRLVKEQRARQADFLLFKNWAPSD